VVVGCRGKEAFRPRLSPPAYLPFFSQERVVQEIVVNLNNARVADPFAMASFLWPDVKFYSRQREVIRSVRDNDETFVSAGNMLGRLPPGWTW
jgi:hypothetical protein